MNPNDSGSLPDLSSYLDETPPQGKIATLSEGDAPPSEPTPVPPPTSGGGGPPVAAPPPSGAPSSSKRKIPYRLLIFGVVGLWLSMSATILVYFVGRNRAEEAPSEIVAAPTTIPTMLPPDPGPSEVTTSVPQTSVTRPKVYRNEQYGFTIDMPTDWKVSFSDRSVWLYEGAADDPQLPIPYPYGRATIRSEDAFDGDILTWFDGRYPPDTATGQATVRSTADVPEKRSLYTNRNGVPLLETRVDSDDGPLRYYGVFNGTVVSFTFNATEDEVLNRNLQVVYGRIIDGIAIVDPAEAR